MKTRLALRSFTAASSLLKLLMLALNLTVVIACSSSGSDSGLPSSGPAADILPEPPAIDPNTPISESAGMVNGFYLIRESDVGEALNDLNEFEVYSSSTREYTLRNGENVIDESVFNDGVAGITGITTFDEMGAVQSSKNYRANGELFINITYGYWSNGLLERRISEFESAPELNSVSVYDYDNELPVRLVSYRDGIRFADVSYSLDADGNIVSSSQASRPSDTSPIEDPYECDVSYTNGLKTKIDCFLTSSANAFERRLFESTLIEYDENETELKSLEITMKRPTMLTSHSERWLNQRCGYWNTQKQIAWCQTYPCLKVRTDCLSST